MAPTATLDRTVAMPSSDWPRLAKSGIAFWDYLGSRLGVSGQPTVLPLPDLIRCRGQPT